MKIPLINYEISFKKANDEKSKLPDFKQSTPVIPPNTRESVPEHTNNFLGTTNTNLELVTPEFEIDCIDQIRKLTKINPNFSQAIKNVINLGNTGHKIQFDPSVDAKQVDLMRKHIQNKTKKWAKLQGAAGADGLVNKLIYQTMVAGSLCLEKVYDNAFKGIAHIPLIKPDKVRWVISKRTGLYAPYQIVNNPLLLPNADLLNGNLKPLNFNTLIYFGLYSDNEVPYGIPPYMAALPSTVVQAKMLDNIDFIVEQVGLLGFMQILLQKERQRPDEAPNAYISRLNAQLKTTAENMSKGMRNGINVGFKDDVEYQFHSATKSVSGVTDLFNANEIQMLSGLGQDGSLMGRDYGASEGQITVVFMKMVAEFKNIQLLVKYALEDIYTDELLLAGFKFDYLKIKFNTSTLQDEVKWQQGQQYKIANIQQKYLSGWISQDQAADEMDYETPDQELPRDIPTLAQDIVDQQERQKQKNDSAIKGRNKNKPVEKSVEDKKTKQNQ
jgi:hypothetical protein